MHYPRQDLGDLRRVGILKVHHPNITALLERYIEIINQTLDTFDTQLIRSHNHTVGSLIGNERRFLTRIRTFTCARLFQSLEHLNHVSRDPIPQLDDLRFFHGRLIHAGNDFFHTINVRADIGNDDRVAGCVGRHMSLLGH